MHGFATFQVVGTCAGDVEYKTLTGGTKRATVNVAVNTPEKKDDGSYEQRVTWMRFAFFGDRAGGAILKRCKKGVAVAVVGNIQSYKHEVDGKARTMYNFRPDYIRVMDPKPAGERAEREPADDDVPPEFS